MTPPKSILLVEDDIDDQEFFKDALRSIDNVSLFSIANDGVEAIETLESAVALPDLIFMDVNMPRMNGIECIARLKTNPLMENIPIVMLSTAVWEMDMVRLIGAKAFIKKSGSSLILHEQMEQVIHLDFAHQGVAEKATFEIKPSLSR